MSEWKPRDKNVKIGGIPWFARMTDKARATASGNSEGYIFPCPVDQSLLSTAGIAPDDFLEMATRIKDDEKLVEEFKKKSKKKDWSDFRV